MVCHTIKMQASYRIRFKVLLAACAITIKSLQHDLTLPWHSVMFTLILG